MKIRLIKVGREEYSGTIEVPDDALVSEIGHAILKAARPHLVSADLWLQGADGYGKIMAGFRSVGRYEIESEDGRK